MKYTRLLLGLFLLIAAQVHAQLPSYLPADGLMAWFPFTGNAVDSTGHGHNGTVYGTTNAKGRFGVPNTAFNFNGTSDYIYVPAGSFVKEISVDITSSITISAWVKSYDYFFTSQMQIYWRGDATPAHDPHMLYFNGGQARIRRDIDPGAIVNEVGSPLTGLDTNYHLFTGTYDSVTSFMCMYVDGKLKSKAYLPGMQSYPTATMYNYIGAVDGGTWQFLYGMIDELGIWSRALTPCEVAALYYSVPDIVTGQPVNDTAFVAGVASFSVTAVGPSVPSYQWQVNTGSGFANLSNGAPYSGVNTSVLTITPATTSLSGNLYRCAISSDSCLSHLSNSGKLTVIPATGIFPVTGEVQITLAPNPNSGVFTISCAAAYNPVVVEVTDVVGKVIYSEKIAPAGGVISKQIILDSRISNGTYFVRTSSENINEVFRINVRK